MESVWPGSLQFSCPISLMIFPRFKERGGLRAQRIAPTTALGRLLEDDHFVWYRHKPLDQTSQEHLNLFQKLVSQAPAYLLEYTDREISKIPGRQIISLQLYSLFEKE